MNAMTILSLVGPMLRNFVTEQLLVLGRLFIELGRLCNNPG